MKAVVTTNLYRKQIEPITVVIIFLTQESQEAVPLRIVFITRKNLEGENRKRNEQKRNIIQR